MTQHFHFAQEKICIGLVIGDMAAYKLGPRELAMHIPRWSPSDGEDVKSKLNEGRSVQALERRRKRWTGNPAVNGHMGSPDPSL